MSVVLDGNNDESKSAPCIVMMSPKDIAPSPFGPDVNPPTTPEGRLALKNSISENMIQVPLTAGRIKEGRKEKLCIVCGKTRFEIALELGLAEIPVIVKEYESVEEMRQDALRDNLERRQLPTHDRAALANTLWHSFDVAEDKKEMAAQGFSPRKRAAIAGGISEGSLANYRYVLDSGNNDLIAKMKSGELRISRAASEAKKLTEGKIKAAKITSNPSVTDQMKILRNTFEDLGLATGILRDTVRRGKAIMKLMKQGQVNDHAKLIKQIQAVNQAIAELASSSKVAYQDSSVSTAVDYDAPAKDCSGQKEDEHA